MLDIDRLKGQMMTAFRFFAIIAIFGCVSVAWLALGSTLDYRTRSLDWSMAEEVNARWGPEDLVQPAPVIMAEETAPAPSKSSKAVEKPVEVGDPLASAIKVSFEHEDRYMGLIWFSVYTVRFSGEYAVQASDPSDPGGSPQVMMLRLPDHVRSFENLAVTLDGRPCDGSSTGTSENAVRVRLPSDGKRHTVAVSYLARGRDRWEYATTEPNSQRIPLVQDFTMTASMNFTDIDYPKGSVSPVKKAAVTAEGASATWQYNNLRSNQRMGIEMPSQQNAGPVAARMSYFAPVSLFFFFTVLFTIVLLKKIALHPMHYLFIAAGFFSFHILLAYLVDLISLEIAFGICAAVSVILVVSYMRLVAGVKFAVLYVGLAQLVYLIGFSYAFMWKGHTGLTVVIGAIATLFVLMQATGRVNWSEVFGSSKPAAAPAAQPQPPSQS
jgi:hypothetical protein